ncbi:PREDICTED: HEAT repeat-containing protein 1 homolog [Bactrocera latifrons]|uniref:HEAT repeat-containing protein 1 n=1 Tax=Bactrocera latifrons TaxID=174628 RepID=A0A0K8UIS3_BACLA|nr:PREDICTED: HEAT repeat-containing protein 1 homolog [Bactrocera latifrons]
MSTSLQQQLQRLAVPQTMTLADSRSKASVLFDRKEAGTKTRRIIYEIGLAGLQELTALNPIFQTFENTLFNESTIDLERSVEQKDVNKLLDRNINKFLQHLSPYFLLRPTLMCLEWLIRRFHIQEYNRNALLALALPYHETNAFILILQVIRIKQADQEWNWLHPLQKPGVPVPKTVLINRAASDVAFLKFVCQTTLDAVKELGTRANSLQTQLNFYASVVVGALEHAAAVEEWHIITILPSLLKGLQSEVLDFAAASYIVATQLVARTPVTPKLCNALVERAASVSLERLRQTAVLFLVFLFDKQHRAKPQFSENTLLHLATQKWFIAYLAALAKGNVYLHALYVALLQQALSAIQAEHKDSEALKSFLERLLNEVALNDDSAQEIINAFLNAYEEQPLSQQKALQDGEMIELSSDDDEEMVDNNSNFHAWYSEYLRKLERKYPVAFDHTIKEGLTSNSQEFASKRSVLKMALGFRLKTFDPSATDIYEQLYHHTAKIRAFAVQTLLANLRDYSARPQNMHLLRECLADRIADDSELVVKEILKLPTAEFVQVLDADKVAEALIAILNKVQQDAEHWAPLTAATVQHLTSREIVEAYDTNIILLALMPLLFPDSSSSNTFQAITSILKSPLSAKIGFLQELKLVRDSESFNAVEFKKQFLDVISKTTATPTGLSLFRSAEKHGERIFKNALHFSHFLLLATACLKTDLTGTEAGYVFTQIRTTYRRFRVRQLESKQWDMVEKEKCIPLQLFSDFIVSLAQHTHFEHLFEWEQIHDDLRTFFDIFNLLAEEGFQQTKAAAQQTEWLRTLKEVFDHIFDNAQQKLEFLSNFYVYETNAAVGVDYALLRLRAFKLTNALFKNKNNKLHINTSHVFRIASALNAPSETTRLQALETLQVLKACAQLSAPLQHFVDSILARSYEFSMDHEQFPLILYTILKPTHKKQQPQSLKVLREIVQLVTAADALKHAAFTAQILKTLKHIDDASLLADLIPLGARTLKQTHVENALLLLPQPYSNILQLICDRFEHQTIGTVLLDQPAAWQFIVQLFGAHNVYIQHGGKLRAVPCVLLEALDEYCYEQIPQNYKTDLIKLIVQTMAATETDAVFLSANKLLKRCSINCAPLVELLAQMSRIVENNEASAGAAAKRKSTATSATKRDAQAQNQLTTQVTTKAWKQGVALLELLEHKKKLEEAEQLLPALFDLLRFCLELEEQAVVEYTKQLTLSMLLHCCQLAQASGVQLAKVLPKSTFRIDLIVQCVRGAQNPQTQNNALLLLSHCAALFPHQVLHSVVDVFTFMGSSVVRHDDAFSFHIINNVIESIVPILVRSRHADDAVDNTSTVELVIPVLKVFSDILLDVPEHRRLPLYSKLLLTLGAEQFLWIFLCIVFEAHVLEDEKQRLLQRKHKHDKPIGPAAAAAEKYSKRLEICLELTNQFAPEITLDTCIELLGYIKSMPMDKADTEGDKGKAKKAIDTTEQCLFDVKCRTAKQLRHYKYVIMQYLSGISSSTQFLRKIAMLSDAEQLAIKPYYQNFIIKTLSYIPLVNTAIETVEETSQLKFWKVILHHLHDVLDNAISLLSPDMFLVVIYGLMRHQLVSIRKKVLELLINKLQQRDGYFDRSDPQNFYNLLAPLRDITMGILTLHESSSTTPGTASPSTPTNELVFLQQTALIAIKLLSKMFALQHINEFREILAHLIKVLKQRYKISKIVLATVVLTIIEISSNLKAHSLALLPKYMPQMIEILQDQAKLVQSQPPDNVCIAIITGTQKLFESLPLFLGPYVVDVITTLSTISANISAQQSERDQRAVTALHRISTIWSKIASDVPVRILVPSCEKAYRKLMATHNYADIAVLMQLLPECINKTASTDLTAIQSELGAFFLHTLEFRLQVRNNCERERVASTETVIIEAFVTWVLKLSESSFRPYYQKVFEWAVKQRAERETILTFFLLTNKIAETLKTLFLLFARDIIDDAANLLNVYNASKQNIDADQEALTSDIVKSILSTLYTLFLHDSKDFVTNRRFQVLMQPLVDQLENRLVLESEELQQILQMCVAQLAAAVPNDIMWKQLNYQVLMKTRTNVPEMRILSFNCCLEIARKLGEDFTPLLPETVPFVAELLEDENQRVEKNTRKAVQELENILGESLQSYL